MPAATIADMETLCAAVVAALAASVPSCAGRVFLGRTWPQAGAGKGEAQQFPALLVEDGPEIATQTAPGFGQCRAQVRVTARVEINDDDARRQALNTIAGQVRAAMFGHAAIGALVLVTEEVARSRDTEPGGQRVVGQDQHLVTFRMAGALW
jgi:hypothetical protein